VNEDEKNMKHFVEYYGIGILIVLGILLVTTAIFATVLVGLTTYDRLYDRRVPAVELDRDVCKCGPSCTCGEK
jgi:hypothetical protein